MIETTFDKIYCYLVRTKKLHQKYLDNGRRFIFTKEIRHINQNILDLIIQQDCNFPLELKKTIFSLKEHLIDWIEHWEKEKLNSKPKDLDLFVFKGYKLFPKNINKTIKKHTTNPKCS